ncbi:MAG: hypothetical protein H6701_03240 [Myxococcales bacterium]|nr:hypothetical protein [Myxococcales bacterium]
MNRLALPALLGLALLAGCADDDAETPNIPIADATIAPPASESWALHLTDRTGGLTPPPAGRFRVLALRAATAERLDRDLGEIDAWPHDTEITLPAGAWELTVYLDRHADGDHDACPFPPEPAHTERADGYDNIVGSARTGAGPIEIALERRICGPGDPRTGVEGALVRPADPLLDGVPVFALVTPIDAPVRIASQGMAERPPPRPLRIPLAPVGAPAGETPFTLGELIPGRYRIDVFADDDADHHPTPCGEGPGGGDRYLTTLTDIDVRAGELTPLPEPVTLAPAPCPAALTGVTGRITVAPELAPADGFDPLLGALRIALAPADGGPAILGAPIGGAGVGVGITRPFVQSGLPPGDWRVDIYLDRDLDGRLTPCNPISAGFDAVHVSLDDIRIVDGELTDLGDIELIAHCDGPPTGLTGQIDIEVEDGPYASGRPVRLALFPLDESEPRALNLFTDHTTLEPAAPFARRVPPGRYRARVYVDTDRDGELRRCESDPFGDRAVSEPIDIEITPDTITPLAGPIAVRTLPCPPADVTLAPRIALDPLALDGPLPETLDIELHEAGGWTARWTLPLDPRALGADPLPLDLEPIAPGSYRLTIFVDGDADGELDPCDAPHPDPWQARVELTLDAMTPTADPLLRLEPCAP